MSSKRPTEETLADQVIAPEYMGMTEEALIELRKQASAMVTEVRRDIRDYAWKKVHEAGDMITAATSEEGEHEEVQETRADATSEGNHGNRKKKKRDTGGGE